MDGVPARPLSPEEIELLQTELVEHMDAAGNMPLDVAHGFLTATAAEESLDPLLDQVLGALAQDAGLRGRLERFRAQLRSDLDRDDYGPLILQLPRGDDGTLPLPYGWCQGYMAGIAFLSDHQRDRMLADEQASALLAPILSFLMYEEDQWFDPPNLAAHRETAGELADAAAGLYRWRQRTA
jgi:hypothetical protein